MNRADCQRLRESVVLLPDGLLPAPEEAEVRSHLETCDGCRGLLEEVERLRSRLRDLPPARAPDGFAERVLTRRSSGGGAWKRRVGLAASLLAAAAVVMVVSRMLGPAPESGEATLDVARAPEKVADKAGRLADLEQEKETVEAPAQQLEEGMRQEQAAVEREEAPATTGGAKQGVAGRKGGGAPPRLEAGQEAPVGGRGQQRADRDEADRTLAVLLTHEPELAKARTIEEMSEVIRRRLQPLEVARDADVRARPTQVFEGQQQAADRPAARSVPVPDPAEEPVGEKKAAPGRVALPASGRVRFLKVRWAKRESWPPTDLGAVRWQEELGSGVRIRILELPAGRLEEWRSGLQERGASTEWLPAPAPTGPETADEDRKLRKAPDDRELGKAAGTTWWVIVVEAPPGGSR